MTLSDWMRKTGTTQVRLSQLTGIPQSLISKYARGVKTPQVANAVAIERATDGKVPVEVWAAQHSKKASAA